MLLTPADPMMDEEKRGLNLPPLTGASWCCSGAPSSSSLPADALVCIFDLLPPSSLRACAVANKAWRDALQCAPETVRRRAGWLHRWTAAAAGASVCKGYGDVVRGGGSWHPGGVAISATLHLSAAQNVSFRIVVEVASPGDLLVGITRLECAAPQTIHSADLTLLCMGYDYIMGRSSSGKMAPPSIFYGGRSLRCCFSDPDYGDEGPKIDHSDDGRSPGRLAKLRHLGDWVEFNLQGGVLRAVDHKHGHFCWGRRVPMNEVWVPTVAWTGEHILQMPTATAHRNWFARIAAAE
eukprot:SAG31_NODE_2_length_46263_cov_45.908043_42_plen_294_part_00